MYQVYIEVTTDAQQRGNTVTSFWPAPFFEFNALGPIASQAASVSRFMASCVGCNNSWKKLGMLAHRFTHALGTWCTLLTCALCILFAEWFLSGFFFNFLWDDMRRIKNLDNPTQNHATRNTSCLWTLKTWTSSTRVTKEPARTHNEQNTSHTQNGRQSKVPGQSLIDGVKAMMLPMLALAADVWIALLSCGYGCQCTEQMNLIVHRIGHQHLLRCWDDQPSSKDSSTLPLDNLPSGNLPKRTSLEEQTSLSTIMEMTSTSMLTSTAK